MKSKKNKLIQVGFAILFAILLLSCNNDNLSDIHDTGQITLFATISDGVRSKVTSYEAGESFENDDQISFWGVASKDDNAIPVIENKLLMFNENRFSGDAYWPDGNKEEVKIRCYACYPYNSSYKKDEIVVAPCIDNPNGDLLCAMTDDFKEKTSQSIPLTFYHVMSKVRIEIDVEHLKEQGLKEENIQSISLGKLISTGKVEWPKTGIQPVVQSITKDRVTSLSVAAQSSASFLIVPQNGAEIDLEIKVGTSDVYSTYTCSLDGTAFESGKAYTYLVKLNRTGFVVEAAIEDEWKKEEALPGEAIEPTIIYTLKNNIANFGRSVAIADNNAMVAGDQTVVFYGYTPEAGWEACRTISYNASISSVAMSGTYAALIMDGQVKVFKKESNNWEEYSAIDKNWSELVGLTDVQSVAINNQYVAVRVVKPEMNNIFIYKIDNDKRTWLSEDGFVSGTRVWLSSPERVANINHVLCLVDTKELDSKLVLYDISHDKDIKIVKKEVNSPTVSGDIAYLSLSGKHAVWAIGTTVYEKGVSVSAGWSMQDSKGYSSSSMGEALFPLATSGELLLVSTGTGVHLYKDMEKMKAIELTDNVEGSINPPSGSYNVALNAKRAILGNPSASCVWIYMHIHNWDSRINQLGKEVNIL